MLQRTIQKVKRQPIECHKKFANHISDKELACRTYKELVQLNKKTNNLIKMGKRFEKAFLQRIDIDGC